MYIFHKSVLDGLWRQEQKIFSRFPVANEKFGFSVAMNQYFVVIGMPYHSVNAGLSQVVRPRVCHFTWLSLLYAFPASIFFQGGVDVYRRVYLNPYIDSFTHVYLQTLISNTAQTSDQLGYSVSLSGFMLAAGGPSRFTSTQSEVVRWLVVVFVALV